MHKPSQVTLSGKKLKVIGKFTWIFETGLNRKGPERKMEKLLNILLFILLLQSSCNSSPHVQENINDPVSHAQWTALLEKYITAEGNVDYQEFQKDSAELNNYLAVLEANPPNNSWTKEEQKAYWINAYNAYTIQLILRHYPLSSIKDIGSKIQIPFINSPWDIKFITIGEHDYDLNTIEHKILRKEFDDPRIHFAIVCASGSCPKLLDKAYEASKLDEQLDEQAKEFINDPSRNKLSNDEIKISKIFSWFNGDFTKSSSIIDFINKYSEVKISEDANVNYLEYDWGLNDVEQ